MKHTTHITFEQSAHQGNFHAKIDPGSLRAAFYIPTAIVPPLLVTHALIFGLLLRPKAA